MEPSRNYQMGLLYLIHLLISADGIVDDRELAYLLRIKKDENIPDPLFKEFGDSVNDKKDKEIFKTGIDLISACTDEEKLNAFVHLYKMSEVDGSIHAKEVRILLYSVNEAGIEFNDVVNHAKKKTK
jgi:uncharacterized tellurite resistance protein B-like protein